MNQLPLNKKLQLTQPVKKPFNSLTSATRFERQTDFLQFLNEALEGI